jgi:hypothetical protein
VVLPLAADVCVALALVAVVLAIVDEKVTFDEGVEVGAELVLFETIVELAT